MNIFFDISLFYFNFVSISLSFVLTDFIHQESGIKQSEQDLGPHLQFLWVLMGQIGWNSNADKLKVKDLYFPACLVTSKSTQVSGVCSASSWLALVLRQDMQTGCKYIIDLHPFSNYTLMVWWGEVRTNVRETTTLLQDM